MYFSSTTPRSYALSFLSYSVVITPSPQDILPLTPSPPLSPSSATTGPVSSAVTSLKTFPLFFLLASQMGHIDALSGSIGGLIGLLVLILDIYYVIMVSNYVPPLTRVIRHDYCYRLLPPFYCAPLFLVPL